MKKALITGITGQDGSYLAELLLSKGYEVHGIIRRSSTMNRERIDHLTSWRGHEGGALRLHYGDLGDSSSLNRILRMTRPDEIYNLGAQSHVKISFDTPEFTGNIDGLGAARLLEAILDTDLNPKFYQASSSEMFGKVRETPQNETTPFYPRSPYAAAKVYAYWITVNYREAHGIFACNGILFNHESPRRGENFVSRKITRAATRIAVGLQSTLYVGNLNARRDWGFAAEYVEGMWKMLQVERPDDYVLATGETHTVRDLVTQAFGCVDIPLEFRGEGANEVGLDNSGQVRVAVHPEFFRPTEVDLLVGDYGKAEKELRWAPRVRFPDLVKLMVEADYVLALREVADAPKSERRGRSNK